MGAYLVDNPPRQRQFKERGTDPSGVVVVHTAESTPDWVGADTGAENVARFIEGRSDYGSYHTLVDSDSRVNLVPYHMQAYGDGTGSNPHAFHVSAATQAHKWKEAGKEWRADTVRNMALASAHYARWLKREHGIEIPAKRISRAESERRVPGFISHGERDPGRRSDPGENFPWRLFLDTYAAAMKGTDDKPKPERKPGNLWDDLYREARKIRKAMPDDAEARRNDLTKIMETAAPWSINHKPDKKN
jgi:hypothetical protein